MSDESKVIDINGIMKMLPHRYPLLLVDRILEINSDIGIVGSKNVSINEQFFNGHFPGHPIMPGVLIIEAMAQAAGIFVMSNSKELNPAEHVVYFMSIEEAQFRKPVVPGDCLHLHITKIKNRGAVWKMKGEARVDGQRVANAIFSAMIVKKENE
ncbi:MAG: 3-hydroxyacyl-ACP dehydratase FabZ [Candidatus Jidaibacter sp.]|jgi:3-hydroxyacyl-[acyl-carrier-protein] dehydratase|nr:3-hydroxyacyl-ACP dehydratase FabZ [Candidatus Jidaibacter sp.]